MGKKAGTIQQTGAQAAAQQIGMQQAQDWQTRWAPVLKDFSASTMQAAAPGSAARQHATSLATIDNSARFGRANEAAVADASRTGTFGSSRQKLGITSLGDAQAATTGFQSADADQGVTDAAVQGLGAVARVGRGNADSALAGLNRQAAISGQQAANDAGLNLDKQIGIASLASKIIGTGAGLWMGQPRANDQLPTTGDFTRMDRGLAMGDWDAVSARAFVGDAQSRSVEAKARADAEGGDFAPPSCASKTYQAALQESMRGVVYTAAFRKRSQRIERKGAQGG